MQRDPLRVSLHGGKTNSDARVCDRASGKGGVQWEYIARTAVRRPYPAIGTGPQIQKLSEKREGDEVRFWEYHRLAT